MYMTVHKTQTASLSVVEMISAVNAIITQLIF